jgi:hypothetical protein
MATLNEAFDSEDLRPIIIFQTDGDELGLLRDTVLPPSIPPNMPPDMKEQMLKSLSRSQQYYRDNMRQFSIDDVYNTAEKSRTTIYTVIPGFKLIGLAPDEQIKQVRAYREKTLSMWNFKPEIRRIQEESFKNTPIDFLKHFAEQTLKMQTALAGVAERTGGWTDFLEDPAQAEDIYSRIFSDINRRYIVGYYPTNGEADGKRRKVNVEVRGHPEYVVWGRKSYLAASR